MNKMSCSDCRSLFLRCLSSAGILAGLVISIGLPGRLAAQDLPQDVTGPQAETIDVTGQAMVPLSHHYRQLEWIFKRFNSYPKADREGLAPHVYAALQPGDRPGASSGLMMRRGQEIIHLIPGPDDEIILPHEADLWESNPQLFGRLKAGEKLQLSLYFTITPADPQHFTRVEAQKWLSQLDRCIRDEGGFLIALLLPDTHKLGVDIAPGSRLELKEGATTRLLVDNQGAQPYHYVFRPQDFRRDAEFVASKPVTRIGIALPFALHGELSRK